MDYFYIENETQVGPVDAEKLVSKITLDTKVWCPGMSDWQSASNVPELVELMNRNQANQNVVSDPYSNPQQGNDYNQQPSNGYNQQNNGYYQQPNNGYNQQQNNGYYQQPNGYNQPNMPKPDNHLVWAILSLALCGCIPLGIVSIIQSTRVDSLWAAGDYAGAQEASRKAKNFAIWGAVSMALVFVLYFVFAVALQVAANV